MKELWNNGTQSFYYDANPRDHIWCGLQKYMQRVYNVMAAGLVLTGFVAYVTFQTPQLFQAVHGSILGIIIMLSPLGIIFFGLFTPIALLMRISGRDELRLKFNEKASHWISRGEPIKSESLI